MLGYLSVDIICSEWRIVFRERSSRKTVSYEEQIMSKDKYPSIFSPQMEAIVFIILQIFYATRAVLKIGKYPRIFPSFSWGIFSVFISHVIKTEIVIVQQINSRIWNVIDYYNINNLAKNQVSVIFHLRAIRRSGLPKFTELCIETPCWCPSGWAPTWQPETNRNICHWVLLQRRKFISRGTQKQYSTTSSNVRTVQIAKFPEISFGISDFLASSTIM